MNYPRLPRLAALALAIFSAVGSLCLWLMSLTTAPVAQAAGESVQFSAATYAVNEADGSVLITVNVSPTVSGDPITFTLATTDGTAQAASDFAALGTTVSLNDGATGYTFTIPITNDVIYEGSEQFTLTLSNVLSGTLGIPNTATITITDNETQPTVQLSSGAYTVTEGAGSATLTAQLSGASAFPVSVNVVTTEGSAGASDYTGVNTTLNFAPGTTLTSTAVAINPDTLDENDETFIATLSAPVSATLTAPTTATVTITDDDTPPLISLNASTQTVAESVGAANVGVTLSTASGRNVTVPFTVSGTAGGADHTLVDGSFTINAGLASGGTTFSVMSDTVDEENETVIVTLGTPVNASPTAPTAQTITINDDDDPPS
ncbi:MAG: Calx-beta domain-containing protein, partial [Anaerolineales bacterium]